MPAMSEISFACLGQGISILLLIVTNFKSEKNKYPVVLILKSKLVLCCCFNFIRKKGEVNADQ